MEIVCYQNCNWNELDETKLKFLLDFSCLLALQRDLGESLEICSHQDHPVDQFWESEAAGVMCSLQ